MSIPEAPAPQPRTAGPLWRVDELAPVLRCSERHVWRQIATGKLRAIRIGRRVFVPDEVVQAVVKNGC
jgi:excisionase family DNA binding protein